MDQIYDFMIKNYKSIFFYWNWLPLEKLFDLIIFEEYTLYQLEKDFESLWEDWFNLIDYRISPEILKKGIEINIAAVKISNFEFNNGNYSFSKKQKICHHEITKTGNHEKTLKNLVLFRFLVFVIHGFFNYFSG